MSYVNCQFNVASRLFLHISGDNRIHLWDIESKKEKISYVDKNHLSHKFNCFSWSQQSIDSHIGDTNISTLSVGYSDGKILNWDLLRGVPSSSFDTIGNNIPSGIVYSLCKKYLFISSLSENLITKYSLSSGEVLATIRIGKKPVSKVAINPKVDVIAASSGSALKLLDIESGRRKKLLASLSGGAGCLLFSPCGCFLIASAGRSGREVLIFDVRADAALEPVYVVSIKDTPVGIDCKSSVSAEVLELLVVGEKGGAYVFQVRSDYLYHVETGEVPVLCMTEVTCEEPIIAGFLGSIANRNSHVAALGATFAVGKTSAPSFIHVHTHNPSTGVCHAAVTIPIHLGISTESNGNVKAAIKDSVVLGPNETAGKKRPVVALENGSSVNKDVKLADQSGSSEPDKKLKASEPELTLEQRLESVSRQLTALESTDAKPKSRSAPIVPTSDSLSVLIEQALQGGDDSLLEQCLGCTDSSVVESTARRLSAQRIVPFLRKLVAKFEKRPTRGVLLTMWLSAVLRFHTSFLVTVPDLSLQLAGLLQLLESRLSTYCRLSSLAGRLDLLLSQVSYLPREQDRGGESGFKPVAVHREEDEEGGDGDEVEGDAQDGDADEEDDFDAEDEGDFIEEVDDDEIVIDDGSDGEDDE